MMDWRSQLDEFMARTKQNMDKLQMYTQQHQPLSDSSTTALPPETPIPTQQNFTATPLRIPQRFNATDTSSYGPPLKRVECNLFFFPFT